MIIGPRLAEDLTPKLPSASLRHSVTGHVQIQVQVSFQQDVYYGKAPH
jgi:hypothetical protein